MWTEAMPLAHLRETESWIAWTRVGAVVFMFVEVLGFSGDYPPGYKLAACLTSIVFAVGALAFLGLTITGRQSVGLGLTALAFDTAVIATYATIYSFDYGSQARWALIFVIVEGALRYGTWGGAGLGVALVPFFVFVELWRAHRFGPPAFQASRVVFPAGIQLVTGLVVGWLVGRLDSEATSAQARAEEAELLRDELGRRVDTLEAVNRCARALGSSLELETAFGAFLRELRGFVPVEWTSIVLFEGEVAHSIAVAGRDEEEVYAAGRTWALTGPLMQEALAGRTVVREDMSDGLYEIEHELVEVGLRSRVAAPLFVGARPIGVLSVSRDRPGAFRPEEVELLVLLGRLAGTAVQNIRAYEGERQTADELRRLSALRADFVSLVSHELRSPMAAVIGSARTLQQRWRQLSPEHRDAFLALIADETNRLSTLIADVLDTSRIEAGTFSYAFTDVDMAELVDEAIAAATVAQDEVPVQATAGEPVPRIRADRGRLRQILTNLIDNAVKYSPAGRPVEVTTLADDGQVQVRVRDHGAGIDFEQQRLIFEKFGRAEVPGASAKAGTGLGLFIARSIAEAHGGTLDVQSVPGEGATFTLTLPTA